MIDLGTTRRGRLLGALPPLSASTRRRRTWLRRAGNGVLAPLVRGVAALWLATCRVRFVGLEALPVDGAFVFATWHEHLFGTCVTILRESKRGRRLVTLISPSVDGDLATRIAHRAGCDVVRGSATRSGAGALRTLLAAVKREGDSPVLVTDGPKGPARESKQGAVQLARMAGIPLVPIATAAFRERRLSSWDRFRVPLPFSRLVVLCGAPRPVDRELDADDLDAAVRALDGELERLSAEAERLARGSD